MERRETLPWQRQGGATYFLFRQEMTPELEFLDRIADFCHKTTFESYFLKAKVEDHRSVVAKAK
jgi:hypothetical protein